VHVSFVSIKVANGWWIICEFGQTMAVVRRVDDL